MFAYDSHRFFHLYQLSHISHLQSTLYCVYLHFIHNAKYKEMLPFTVKSVARSCELSKIEIISSKMYPMAAVPIFESAAIFVVGLERIIKC